MKSHSLIKLIHTQRHRSLKAARRTKKKSEKILQSLVPVSVPLKMHDVYKICILSISIFFNFYFVNLSKFNNNFYKFSKNKLPEV